MYSLFLRCSKVVMRQSIEIALWHTCTPGAYLLNLCNVFPLAHLFNINCFILYSNLSCNSSLTLKPSTIWADFKHLLGLAFDCRCFSQQRQGKAHVACHINVISMCLECNIILGPSRVIAQRLLCCETSGCACLVPYQCVLLWLASEAQVCFNAELHHTLHTILCICGA